MQSHQENAQRRVASVCCTFPSHSPFLSTSFSTKKQPACRQRRIKCGEERPTCQNCIKSKRDCQGYNQRVIFKEPLNALRPPASVTRLAGSQQQQQPNAQFQQYQPSSQHTALPQYDQGSQKTSPGFTASSFNNFQISGDSLMGSMHPSHQQQFHSYQPGSGSSTSGSSPEANAPPTPSFQAQEDFGYYVDQPEPSRLQASHAVEPQYGVETGPRASVKQQHQPHVHKTEGPSFGWNGDRNSASHFASNERPFPSNTRFTALDALHQSYQSNSNCGFPSLDGAKRLRANQYSAPYRQEHVEVHEGQQNQRSEFKTELHNENLLQPQFNRWQENLPLMGISRGNGSYEEEVEIQEQQLQRNDLGNIMALKAAQDNQNWQLRSLSTFLDEPNLLTTYQPSSSPTPLDDPVTARIFLHFINVTGQNISMYERHPADPGLMFSGHPVPHDNQHLWSCQS